MCAEELESVKSRLFSQKCIIGYTIYIFVAHIYNNSMHVSTQPLEKRARTHIDLECLSTTHDR